MNNATQTSEERWRKALLNQDSTLEQVILNLNQSALQIALLITSEGRLVGTLTDGDIRRGLLRGLNLKSSVSSIINREPVVTSPELASDAVLQVMRTSVIQQLPIVDKERRVVGLYVLDEFFSLPYRPNTMVIMAGGKGTRLRPLTETCPKPLLSVGGKPILERILERAKAEGFQSFVIAVHYLGQMIEDHFGNGNRWQVKIDYLREELPLGTAGALSLIKQRPDVPFIVTNGDVLTDLHYGEMLDFHNRHTASATMAVRLHEWQNPFGVVSTTGIDIIGFEEKPIVRSHINAGIYVLSPNVLEVLIHQEPCDMPELFSRLKEKGERTIVYPIHESWLDVGRLKDYEKAQAQQFSAAFD